MRTVRLIAVRCMVHLLTELLTSRLLCHRSAASQYWLRCAHAVKPEFIFQIYCSGVHMGKDIAVKFREVLWVTMLFFFVFVRCLLLPLVPHLDIARFAHARFAIFAHYLIIAACSAHQTRDVEECVFLITRICNLFAMQAQGKSLWEPKVLRNPIHTHACSTAGNTQSASQLGIS